ncbi:MFS transporter [Pseudomonas sp. G11-1]|nr:MFS transporter [Pseudomonas sp. G11-1]MCO5791163.1 MFS transporter [Pseudomonas sp. G11-2]
MSNQPTAELPIALCQLDDLADPGSQGFVVQGRRIFAVRQGQRVFAYLNRCPHRGIPLEWVPDQFLDSSGRLIQCASHGALFLPETGECVAGPCSGDRLLPLPCRIEEGQVWLLPSP